MKIALTFLATLFTAQLGYTQEPCDNIYPIDRPIYFHDFRVQSRAQASNHYKFVSYNINVQENDDLIIRDLTSNASLKDADFILLQEVAGEIGKPNNAALRIAQKMKMFYAFSPNIVLWRKDYGNAVLSRWPLTAFRKVYLPNSTKENCNQRSAFVTLAQTPSGPIQVASVHLSVTFDDTVGGEPSRALQLEPALKFLVQNNTPSFIAGDMNTANPWGTKKVYAMAEKYQFGVAQVVKGPTNKKHRFQLDQAFAHGPFKLNQSGIENNAEASDHVPIWSILEMNSQRR